MNKGYWAAGLVAITLAGCSTKPIVPFSVGGSKADGIITMGVSGINNFSGPVAWEAGQNAAVQRCQRWGYAKAEPFAGVSRQCSAFNQYGCVGWDIKRQYQCS